MKYIPRNLFIKKAEEKLKRAESLALRTDKMDFYYNLDKFVIEWNEISNLSFDLIKKRYPFNYRHNSKLWIDLNLRFFIEKYITITKEICAKFDGVIKFIEEQNNSSKIIEETYSQGIKIYIDNTVENKIDAIVDLFNIFDKTKDSFSAKKIISNDEHMKFRSNLQDEILKYKNFFYWTAKTLYYTISRRLPNLYLSPSLTSLIENELRNYCNEEKEYISSILEKEVRKHKIKPNEEITPDVWGRLAASDNEELRKEATRLYDDGFQGISRVLNSCLFDEKLFDFDSAIECGLLRALHIKNFDYFCKTILRKSIVQCGMFPKLKPQFEAWLNCTATNPIANEVETETNPLFTPEAMVLWEKLQKAGLVDEQLQPKVSMRKASIIAAIMGDLLNLYPLWINFEELWKAKNLDNSYSQAKNYAYYADISKDVRKLLSSR